MELKNRVIDWLIDEVRSGRHEFPRGELESLKAWVLIGTEDREGVEAQAEEFRTRMVRCLEDDGKLSDYHHICRIGRLMFRFGRRGLSLQCAKVIGCARWESGWPFQPVAGVYQRRIRILILRPGSDADAWMRDPALACSAMSIRLWLADGVERVFEHIALFRRADECPWLFPRLHFIYQWHLALAGKDDGLRQIERFAPEVSVGLSAGLSASR